MSDEPHLSASEWPPPNALKYVQREEFLQLLTDAAMELQYIEEIGGAFSLVLDWFERKCALDSAFFKRFASEDHLKRYLKVALRSRAKDVKRRWAQSLPLAPLRDEELVTHPLSPLEQVSNEELIERAAKALESLSPMQRDIVKNIIISGHSFRETALLLGISVSAAYRYYKKAIHEVAGRIGDV